VASWGSRLFDNTDLSPPPPPPIPAAPCPNSTTPGLYRECTFTVVVGARDSGGKHWADERLVVKAGESRSAPGRFWICLTYHHCGC
jgi:hypothetical protein